jgi:hypothetical protein
MSLEMDMTQVETTGSAGVKVHGGRCCGGGDTWQGTRRLGR